MTSDIGMTKPVASSVAQINPTASTGRVESEGQIRENPETLRKAEEAQQEKDSLENVVSDLNQLVRELQRELQFSVDKDSGDTVIKVIDKETEEVLRQIPSEDLMNLRKRLEEAAGVIFQDSA